MAKKSKKKGKASHKKRTTHKKKVSGIIKPQITPPQLINPPCNFDETLNLPPSGHVTMYGLKDIPDANYSTNPGIFEVEVDLGMIFNSQPTIQLTRKQIHDPSGNVYDTGDHSISYRWVDCNTFRTFKIITDASRLNYPPTISYQVTGNIGANL